MASAKGLLLVARSAVTFCFGISFIANVFLESPLIDSLNLGLMVAVVALSFVSSEGSARTIGTLLLFSGIVLLICSHAPLSAWGQALQENSQLVVMFITVPLLGIPIRCGGYGDSLREAFGRHAGTGARYYALVSVMTALLGVLLSIAAVPLSHEVSRTSCHCENKKLVSTALSRGFVTCMIWAPTSATIALVVQLTGVDWVDLFPSAFACALVAGAVGAFVACAEERRKASLCAMGASKCCSDEPALPKIIELCVFFLVLIASIVGLSQMMGLSVIVAVAAASLFLPVVWMTCIGRLPVYEKEFRGDYFKRKLPSAGNQIALFVGAGFFAQGMSSSHVGDVLMGALAQVAGQSVLLLTVAVIGLVLATSAVGIHPVAIVAVAGGAMSASGCGITPTYAALVLSISWAMGNALCPASANVVTVSNLVGRSPIEVSLRWNGLYVLVASVVLVLVLTLLRSVGLA